MQKIEIAKVYVQGNTIHYKVYEDTGLGLLKKEVVDLFIKYQGDEHFDFDLSKATKSILLLPLSLYMLPITYFYNVELIIPEMDKTLYESLSQIYDAYSRIYGPFHREWQGKIRVKKVVENNPLKNTKYDKIVFFSGGVDACHAGINNSGRRSLLVSIPDIERNAKNEGPLREEKFSLIRSFSKVVNSDWLLITNNFNGNLCDERIINAHLRDVCGLSSEAYKYDGWGGIRYLANMCSVAPIAYLSGTTSLIMGSTFEQIEDRMLLNCDGAHPDLSNSIKFFNSGFGEQDGLFIRRSKKVENIIKWCKSAGTKTKMWVCFSDSSKQCGYCVKCVRTQINILCAGENPKDWGFENFSEKEFTKYVRAYNYKEFNPCWMWDNIESIEDFRVYPYCNELLHWLKKIGYKEYHRRAIKKSSPSFFKKMICYIRNVIVKLNFCK